MARSKIRSTGPKNAGHKKKKKKKEKKRIKKIKTDGGPLLKESPFSNVVLAILGENSPLQSGVVGEIFTHFQLFIGTV